MYRLVVSDLDGTLLDAEHRLGQYSKSVLRRLGERGIDLMLASGRHFLDIRVLAFQLGGEGGLISSNGAAIHDRLGERVHTVPIDPECIPFLTRDPLLADVHINVYRSTDWLVARPEPHLLRYHRDSGFAYRVVDLDSIGTQDILKVFYYGEPSALRRLEGAILERYGERLTTTFSLPVTLEVMATGVSKGAALARVVKRLGVELKEVVAFGDGMNDLEMLAMVGRGLLVDNADPRLGESLPGLERIGPNSQQSVARWLARELLRE